MKTEIGSGVKSSTESETEEQNVSISSDSVSDSMAYDSVKTKLSESEAEVASHADVLGLATRDKPKNVCVGGANEQPAFIVSH